MFIRQCHRRKNGKRHAYWALVESYRGERGPRQRVVAWLGKLDEAGRLGVRRLVDDGASASSEQQRPLFDADASLDDSAPEVEPRWIEVDASRVRVENCRQFGGPWLARELIRRLRLDEFFARVLPAGRERVPWSSTALVLVIARLLTVMEGRYGKSDRVWVMDRGMVSEANLEFLRQGGRRYIVGTPKSMLKKFERELLQEDWHTIREGLEVIHKTD